MKKYHWIDKLYLAIVIVILILWGVCGLIESHYLKMHVSQYKEQELTPTNVTSLDNGTYLEYEFTDIKWQTGNHSIMFYSSHQDVYVIADGTTVFERTRAHSIFGHTAGSTWNCITIPVATKTLIVKLEADYGMRLTNAKVKFIQGNAAQMVLDKIGSGLMHAIVCLLIFAMGFCIMVYYFVAKHAGGSLRELLYLGLFAMFLGYWAFGETDLAQMIIRNRIFSTFCAFSSIAAMGPAAVMFAHEFFKTRDKYLYKIIAGYGLLAMVVPILLQMIGVLDMRQLALPIQLVVVLTFIYWVYADVIVWKRGMNRGKAIVNTIGLAFLALSFLRDIIAFYTDRAKANQSAKFGFLIYIVILGFEVLYYSTRSVEEQKKLEYYRMLATTDLLTGCLNRNAFEHDMKEYMDKEDCTIVTFDLNNLKLCNDTFGHNAGDHYIQNMARLLRELFERNGSIYRTGGDEFVALLHSYDHRRLESNQIKLMRESTLFMEEQYHSMDFGIACGDATFDPAVDSNLSDTLKRADAKMYEMKKQMKTTPVR